MPRSLNRCTFIGRIATSPKPGAAPDGVATTRFIIAVPDSDRSSTLVPITGIGKVAAVCNRLLRLNDEVYIEGKYHTRRIEVDGEVTVLTEIQLENMQMFERPEKTHT